LSPRKAATEKLWGMTFTVTPYFFLRNARKVHSGRAMMVLPLRSSKRRTELVGLTRRPRGIVLENGGDGENGQAGGDFLEDVGRVALAELGLIGGDLLGDEGVGAAGDDGDVEALGGEEAAGGGLVDAAVLGLGDPIELDGEFEGGLFGVGGGGVGGAGDGKERGGGEDEAGEAAERGAWRDEK